MGFITHGNPVITVCRFNMVCQFNIVYRFTIVCRFNMVCRAMIDLTPAGATICLNSAGLTLAGLPSVLAICRFNTRQFTV